MRWVSSAPTSSSTLFIDPLCCPGFLPIGPSPRAVPLSKSFRRRPRGSSVAAVQRRDALPLLFPGMPTSALLGPVARHLSLRAFPPPPRFSETPLRSAARLSPRGHTARTCARAPPFYFSAVRVVCVRRRLPGVHQMAAAVPVGDKLSKTSSHLRHLPFSPSCLTIMWGRCRTQPPLLAEALPQ